MTKEEAVVVIKFEKACVLRQDTPQCHRDCKKCDLLLPTMDVLTAYDMAIKALKQKSDEDYANRLRLSIIGEFLNLRDIAGCYPDRPKRASKKLKEFLKNYGYDDEELAWADNNMFVKGWYCASHALYEGLKKILAELCITKKESEE